MAEMSLGLRKLDQSQLRKLIERIHEINAAGTPHELALAVSEGS